MAFEAIAACETTVSLLRAVTLGAGDACVSLDLWSLAAFGAVFIGAVIALQFGAHRALGLRKSRKPMAPPAKVDAFDVKYDGGPIKSTEGWRS
ncbi:hypothetical protein [Litoreibacter janthinus]|uniref:Uncharacterized protein n=1 Tax=Litoreibacter janthinus TaxID=670154 RepID=A0A1I6HCN9_9RHOB|nr:hypothetical protein [Litoreibacter janthinus]SFR52144.1 hypothetical protein SAMN04488002_2820 [Litoreibacter janthinus]